MIAMAFKKMTGLAAAAAAAFTIAGAAVSSAEAAPATAGSGALVRDTVPALTGEVGWRGRGGWHGRRVGYGPRFHRPARFHRPYGFYRPYRPAYFGGPVFAGPRCFWRPGREVFTPYGVRFVPARRVCRY